MSTLIETISKSRTRPITDVEVVCLMTLLGMALTAALVWLGFQADAVQGLTS
jgi:hypothetical protein